MNRRSFVAALLALFLAPFARAGKKTTRILVVFAPNELQAEQHARSMLERWQDVGGRRYWPETITRTQQVIGASKPRPINRSWVEFRYTMEGIDGGEAEIRQVLTSYWDCP